MTGLRDWKGGAPAFFLGGALAIAAEVAVGLLLYGGPGLIPALSVVLATAFLALGTGIAAGEGHGVGTQRLDGLRSRWLTTLVAFTVAGVFTAGWEFFQGYGAGRLSQGLGLAVLVALPLHAGGRTLGALSRAPGGGGSRRVGAWALSGAATGVLVLGFVFFPGLSPTAILLVCLVAVSGGALLHGWMLDEVMWSRVVASTPGPRGLLTVERWTRGRPRTDRMALREGERLRALRGKEGEPVLAEEHAVEEALRGWPGARERILAVGLGAVPVALRLRVDVRGSRMDVVEAGEAGIRSVIRHFGRGDAGAGVGVLDREPEAFVRGAGEEPGSAPERYDLIVVDALAFAHAPSRFRFPAGAPARVRELLAPGGLLVVLPLAEAGSREDLVERLREARDWFGDALVYLGARSDGRGEGIPPEGGFPRIPTPEGERPAVLVAGDADLRGLPGSAAGFLRVDAEASRTVGPLERETAAGPVQPDTAAEPTEPGTAAEPAEPDTAADPTELGPP